jgi:putative flippase GtrA
MHLKKSHLQMIKYGVTGGIGSVQYFLLVVLLVEVFHVPQIAASFFSFLTTVVSSFLINCFWTFDGKSPSRVRFLKYCVVSVSGLLLATSITYVGELLQVWYVYSQIVVVIVVPISNYLLNSQWVFAECEVEAESA